jgi:hypothetical protein
MASLPTIGAGLVVTNAVSSGYLAFLAAAKSLLCVVDELVVVDGGSTDDTLAVLCEWVRDDPRVTIIRTETTHWGAGDLWDLQQLAVNLNTVLQSLTTDWGYVFSADYVLDVRDAAVLRKALSELQTESWVRTSRRFGYERGDVRRNDRCMLFNLALMRANAVPIGFGLDPQGGPSDFPIQMREVARFTDRETGVVKPMFRGPLVPTRVCVRCDFVAYGHFFYTTAQVNDKILRWERAISRWYGAPVARLWELRVRHHLMGTRTAMGKQEVLALDHPVHVREVIEALYEDGMVGGMRQPDQTVHRAIRHGVSQAGRVDRKARGCIGWSGRSSPAPGAHEWTPATDADFDELRVPVRTSLADFVRTHRSA